MAMASNGSALPFCAWVVSSLLLRLVIIAATCVLEGGGSHNAPTYTDIDYHVFTDAGALVLQGNSPYGRATYRYPPVLALVAALNNLLHPASAKVVFALVDVAAGLALRCSLQVLGGVSEAEVSRAVVWGWLLNPIVINISTRGSADSLPCALTIASILGATFAARRLCSSGRSDGHRRALRRWCQVRLPLFAGALAHGLAIHVKLYPVIYLPAFAAFFSSLPGSRVVGVTVEVRLACLCMQLECFRVGDTPRGTCLTMRSSPGHRVGCYERGDVHGSDALELRCVWPTLP